MTTYYLSGPMTGQDAHGFPAFFAAAAHLRSLGYDVVSPAEMSIDRANRILGWAETRNYEEQFSHWPSTYLGALERIPREELLAADGHAVIYSDAVIVLPGWRESEGSRWEVGIARGLGRPVYEYRPFPEDTDHPALSSYCPIVELSQIDLDHDAAACWECNPVTADEAGVDVGPPDPGVRLNDTFWDEAAHQVRVADPSGAVKDDGQKARMDLLPTKPLRAIAEILGFGATKYADHNWRKGFKWSRMYGATLRHLTAWADGEDLDQETGRSHLWHAGCDLLFLIEYEMTNTGTDDRYKPEEA